MGKITHLNLVAIISLSCITTLSGCKTTTSPTTTTQSPVIVKSQLDARQYQFKQLSNGLKVVVISDPDADKAAAALDVHIGHLADPKHREGLSHYLEHMLFLGSEKYPEVGEYGKFISKHGGFNNAGTGMEHTNYYFQIDNDYLEPALDRFSRFFIDPLFDPEYVQKERNAVHSEYKLKIKDDWRRFNEAVKQTANQHHPMTQFSVGNLDTLSHSETHNILQDVKEHHKKYYSAGIMSLVVVGNYPVETLMKWTEQKFDKVPNNGYQRAESRPEPYLESQKGVFIHVNTLENKYAIEMRFQLPESKQYFDKKPIAYINYLLGHEGEGSLFSYLKNKDYIKSLSTGTYGPDDFTRLTVNMQLTPKGFENKEQVIEEFFSYVQLIKQQGLNEKIFKELAHMQNNRFEFQDKYDVAFLASNVANNLQYYPVNNILDHTRVFSAFDKKLTLNFLENIKPQNARIILSYPEFTSTTKEQRYDVAYDMQPIDAQLINRWSKVEPHSQLTLPEENPYIANQLKIKNTQKITRPQLVYRQQGIQVWYENENEFSLPKSHLRLTLYSKKPLANTTYKTALKLHEKIIHDMLSSESYPAMLAGLSYDLNTSTQAYEVTISGYDQKSNLLLDKVLDSFNTSLITEQVFNRVKANGLQEIENMKFLRPFNQLYMELPVEVYQDAISYQTMYQALKTLSYPDFKAIIDDTLSELEIEALYLGNITKNNAKELAEHLQQRFSGTLQDNIKKTPQVINLARGQEYIRQIDIDHNDSSIIWLIQGETETLEERARYMLLEQILKSRFYDSLRTKQQYGYVVSLFDYQFYNKPGLSFLIQSPKAHPMILKEKIEEFIQQHNDYLDQLTDAEYQLHMTGLLSDLEKTLQNLAEKMRRLHSDLLKEHYHFETHQRLIEAVKNISKEDVSRFYKNHVSDKNRRSMVLWNVGKAHQKDAPQSSNMTCSVSKCIFNASQNQ